MFTQIKPLEMTQDLSEIEPERPNTKTPKNLQQVTDKINDYNSEMLEKDVL